MGKQDVIDCRGGAVVRVVLVIMGCGVWFQHGGVNNPRLSGGWDAKVCAEGEVSAGRREVARWWGLVCKGCPHLGPRRLP